MQCNINRPNDLLKVFDTQSPKPVHNRTFTAEANNSRLHANGAWTAIEYVFDFRTQLLIHMARRSRAHISEWICAGCSQRKLEGTQELMREWMIGTTYC